MTYRPTTDTDILRELKKCYERNRKGGIPDGEGGMMLLEPWWLRRIHYLTIRGDGPDTAQIAREGLYKLETRAQVIAENHRVNWRGAQRRRATAQAA